jgi:hypothetical protein
MFRTTQCYKSITNTIFYVNSFLKLFFKYFLFFS